MHHACFRLDTSEVERAPTLCSVSVECVEQVQDAARMSTPVEQKVSAVYAREKLQTARPTSVKTINASDAPESVVIVGSDGAGNAAALMLPQERYAGAIPTLSADDSPSYGRPILSKEALAGTGDVVVTPPPLTGVLSGTRHRPASERARHPHRHRTQTSRTPRR